MSEMSMRIGALKTSAMRISPSVEMIPALSDNPLLEEYKRAFNLTDVEAKQREFQMADEIELEGWPPEISPDCPICKQRLRLDETCAACGWGTEELGIRSSEFGISSGINWAEADCGT